MVCMPRECSKSSCVVKLFGSLGWRGDTEGTRRSSRQVLPAGKVIVGQVLAHFWYLHEQSQ